MKKYIVWENKPAEVYTDAYLLGNGRLGMSVMGGAPQDEILINDDTLWSGSETFHSNPQHYEKMMEARKLALKGDVKGANNIINEDMEGRWFEAYMPLATVHLTLGQKNNRRNMPLKQVIQPEWKPYEEYRRELDLTTAVSQVTYEVQGVRYTREYFVSQPKDAGFISVTAEQDGRTNCLNFAMAVDSKLHAVYGTLDDEAYLTGIAPDHAEPNYTSITPELVYKNPEESDALRIACCAKVIATDGTVHTDGVRVYVNDANFALIAVKAATNYAGFRKERNKDAAVVLERLREELKQLMGSRPENGCWYAQLKEEHIADYQALYGRMDLDLGHGYTNALPTSERFELCRVGVDDADVYAMLLQYTRYLTIAGSRPGSQAMNLQGIWNDTVSPPWSSNYTNNINVEMNYWPCETLGLPECHMPLMDLVEELSVAGQRTAQEYYHSDGWVTHHNADLWRSTEPSCEDASWSWWPMGGGWICEHIWTHYEYTKDTEFLRKMYPVLREAAVFMLNFLTENEEGYLVTAPSISPENKFITGGQEIVAELVEEIATGSRCSPNHPNISAVTVASTMDMSILRELFGNVAKAAEILGIQDDPVPERGLEAIKCFPPYKVGKYGQLLEWYDDYEECTPGQGHLSHMYPVYPANLITETDTPELMTAAKRSLERRMLHESDDGGWPAAWRISLMARFKNSLCCGQLLKQMGHKLGASMLTVQNQQIDAIFGLGAGIAEMLLQSHQGFIEIIPAITVDWCEGSFKGMRARGAFEVSAAWKQGRLYEAEVVSLEGGICCIKAEGLKAVRCGEETITAAGSYAEFATSKGMAYQLVF